MSDLGVLESSMRGTVHGAIVALAKNINNCFNVNINADDVVALEVADAQYNTISIVFKYLDGGSTRLCISNNLCKVGNEERVVTKIADIVDTLMQFIVDYFGSNVHSKVFTTIKGVHSSMRPSKTEGEVDIIWSVNRAGMHGCADLRNNEYHYKVLLSKESSDSPLTYGEAYYFAMQHYNDGGDVFVECVSNEDYNRRVRVLGKGSTKSSLLREFDADKERIRMIGL